MLFRKINNNLIKKSLKSVQRIDCLGFRREEFSIQRYFIRKFFVKKTREENYNKMLSFILNDNEKMLNKNEDKFMCNKFPLL